MVKYCELFYSFFKIGTFTIGGGYAMIPLMEQEIVDRRGWLSREEFLNQLALSQSMPGVLAVNMATGLGYRLRGLRGAFSAIAGNIVMPVLFIITLAMLFRHFRDNPFVERFFMGVRPAVVALIAAPVFRLAQSAKVTWATCWIPILAALLIWLFDVSPILVILAAVVLGFVYGRMKKQ
ncbi:MAG: chromate transporter [Bacteroidales bacterium]|jgi:chromate transporter|nr:chromate transporter [Bacteroidales bacterium]